MNCKCCFLSAYSWSEVESKSTKIWKTHWNYSIHFNCSNYILSAINSSVYHSRVKSLCQKFCSLWDIAGLQKVGIYYFNFRDTKFIFIFSADGAAKCIIRKVRNHKNINIELGYADYYPIRNNTKIVFTSFWLKMFISKTDFILNYRPQIVWTTTTCKLNLKTKIYSERKHYSYLIGVVQ